MYNTPALQHCTAHHSKPHCTVTAPHYAHLSALPCSRCRCLIGRLFLTAFCLRLFVPLYPVAASVLPEHLASCNASCSF